MPESLSPTEFARSQVAFDRTIDRTAKGLFAVKRERMRSSAFAFLRGSAPLFFRLLREHGTYGGGPRGQAWLTGDLHVQNLGAYRSDNVGGEARVVFGPNDFDEACVGPVRLDVLRLATSWLLALDETTAGGARTIESCRALTDGWVLGAFGALGLQEPTSIARLVGKVAARTKRLLHASYVEGSDGHRRLQRNEKLWPVSHTQDQRARRAFAGYATRACALYGAAIEHFDVLDVARRIAGTGSLGCERYAVLARGADQGEWLFDIKEEHRASATRLKSDGLTGAPRVVRGIEIGAPAAPRMLGVARMDGLSMLVRRLSPQEDKLDPSKVDLGELELLGRYIGWISGRMHRRGVVRSLGRAWTARDERTLLRQAIELAGFHAGARLAYISMT